MDLYARIEATTNSGGIIEPDDYDLEIWSELSDIAEEFAEFSGEAVDEDNLKIKDIYGDWNKDDAFGKWLDKWVCDLSFEDACELAGNDVEDVIANIVWQAEQYLAFDINDYNYDIPHTKYTWLSDAEEYLFDMWVELEVASERITEEFDTRYLDKEHIVTEMEQNSYLIMEVCGHYFVFDRDL